MFTMASAFLCVTMLVMLLQASSHIADSARSNIESFKVMDVLARATELEQEGRSIIHLEVGQPSTGAPSKVLTTAAAALTQDRLGYTNVSNR